MASLRFWQAWTIGSLCCCAAFAARLAARPAPVAEVLKVEAVLERAAPLAPSPVVPSVSQEERPDPRLLRLGLAETGSELCQVLGELEPSDDAAVAYAITSVLERTRFRTVRACATQALAAQLSPVAHSWLVDLAEDPQPEVHAAALDALAARTDALALAAVTEAVHSDDLDVRSSAVTALLRARREGALGAARDLVERLDEPFGQASLIEAMGASGDAQALPILRDLIARGGTLSHLRAIEALGVLGARGATSLIEPYFRVSSRQEFRFAAESLLRLAPERALPLLEAAAGDEGSDRSALALEVLRQSGLPGASEVIARAFPEASSEPRPSPKKWRRPRIAPSAEPDETPLELELAGERDPERRLSLVEALVRRGDPRWVETLRRAASDEDSSVRRAAIAGLANLGDASAEALLAGLARASAEDDRQGAITLLAGRADEAATAALERLADDSETSVAASALGELKLRRPGRAVAIAERRLARAPADERAAILDAVADLPSELVMPLYAKALADESDEVALHAIAILDVLEGPVVAQTLLGVARDGARSREVRVTAARVLRGLGGRLARDNQRFLDELRAPDERELDQVACWGRS